MILEQKKWLDVDRYIVENIVPTDEALNAALDANETAGFQPMDVAPNQGKLLALLGRLCGAKKILELGTLGGYSTIWLARALPEGGRLTTLELDPKHAAVAKENIARADLSQAVEILVGPAAESLAKLHAEGAGPFDMIFIDADKPNNVVYLDWALKLSRVGTLIIVDNVVREGNVLDPESPDPSVQGTRALFAKMANEPRLDATAIQTVGSKGWDGFAIGLVVSL